MRSTTGVTLLLIALTANLFIIGWSTLNSAPSPLTVGCGEKRTVCAYNIFFRAWECQEVKAPKKENLGFPKLFTKENPGGDKEKTSDNKE